MSDETDTELGEVDDAIRAELLLRAAEYRGDREGFAIGVDLIDRALELYADLPAGEGLVRALNYKRLLLEGLGRHEDATTAARAAIDAATAVGDPRLLRHQLTALSGLEGINGRLTAASALLGQGRSLLPQGADPLGDVWAAMVAVDALLNNGAPLGAIEDAGRPGLAAAHLAGIENDPIVILRAKLALARIQAGLIDEAEELVDASSDAPVDLDRWQPHVLRAAIDLRKGLLDPAAERIGVVLRDVQADDEIGLEIMCVAADIDFWRGAAHATLPRLLRGLDRCVDSAPARAVLPALVTTARAAVEVRRSAEVAALLSRTARRVAPLDARDPHVQAHLAAASLELARASGEGQAVPWANVAGMWDGLGRPHDAAYARWRAAGVTQRDGHGVVAVRLLKRAAADARTHVPLAAAIARTAAYPAQS